MSVKTMNGITKRTKEITNKRNSFPVDKNTLSKNDTYSAHEFIEIKDKKLENIFNKIAGTNESKKIILG